jgi:cytokinin dehydrogenase
LILAGKPAGGFVGRSVAGACATLSGIGLGRFARFQLSRILPAGTDTGSMTALNRMLYERAREMGGYRMSPSAVAMSQDDWKQHYGSVWQTVEVAKAKFDPKNVLTPGHGMFPG